MKLINTTINSTITTPMITPITMKKTSHCYLLLNHSLLTLLVVDSDGIHEQLLGSLLNTERRVSIKKDLHHFYFTNLICYIVVKNC